MTSCKKKAGELFYAETDGVEIWKYEASFALAYAQWEFKKFEEAIETFKRISTYLSFKDSPSKSTIDFFSGMLEQMLASMKKDKEIKKMIKAIRDKIR